MKRKRFLISAAVTVTVVLASGIAFLLVARQQWQPEPVTLQILEQEVSIYDGHDGNRISSANGTLLQTGNFVKAGVGGSGALLYFEASSVKIDGLAEVQHLWSQSRKARSDLLSQAKFYLSLAGNRLLSKPSTTRMQGTGRSIALEVLYGKITASASRENDPDSFFEVWVPGGVLVTRGATFTANVDAERGTVIIVHQGTVLIGTATMDKQNRAVIAITTLTAGKALSIPPLPIEWRQDEDAYSQLMEKIRTIVENALKGIFVAVKGTSLDAMEIGNGTALFIFDQNIIPSQNILMPPSLPAGYNILIDPLLEGTYLVLGVTTDIYLPYMPGSLRPVIPDLMIKRDSPPVYVSSIEGVFKPLGVAVDPYNRHLFVTESAGSRFTKCFSFDGKELFTLYPPGSMPGDRSPSYVAVDDRTGIVYISDRNRRTIDRYDADGTYLGIFSPASSPDASWSPLGLSFSNGFLYITDVSDLEHRILVVDPASGEIKLEFGEEGKELAQFAFPNAAVSDSKGQIYVADSNNFRIQVFNTGGQALGDFSRWGQGSMGMPRGMDTQGNYIYVADAFAQLVHVFDVEGGIRLVFSFGRAGVTEGQFNYPNDIAVDRDRLYIADRQNNRVQIWSY